MEQASVGCLCHSPAFARLNAFVDRKFSRRSLLTGAAASVGAAAIGIGPAAARVPLAPKGPVAFINVRVFDGKSDALRDGLTIIVEGTKIKAVDGSRSSIGPGFQVIDGGGRTLMPGLIDAHWHTTMAAMSFADLKTADVGYINLVAAAEAERTLMRGFTSLRDVGGPAFSVKRAIDGGLNPGPRIWPSGAMISQTSGHGDLRFPYEVPSAYDAPMNRAEAINFSMIADGVPQVLKRVREQLMLGATQIKLLAGGGVASEVDPLDSTQFVEAELRAACDAADNWGTYVTVHAYTPKAIQTAVRSGVRCIEHGQMMDEDTAKILADKGVWFSSQPFIIRDQRDIRYPEGSASRAKLLQMTAGTETAYQLAKKYKLKTAWGTDILFSADRAARHGEDLAVMKRWYSNAEILKMATGTNAELLAMCGPRNPYPGKVGVIEEGAFADLLLVDGDPLASIDLVADPEKNFTMIMKDGRFYKRTFA